MSFIKNLQIKINKVTEGYYANWTPDSPIAVGDYGEIKSYRFTRDGNISRYKMGLIIDSVRVETATFERTDGLVVNVDATASGNIDNQSAKLDLKFGAEGSFLYHLADITNNQFKERQVAFEKIGQLILSDTIKWKDDYVLVVEVKQAEKTFIIVADSADANMQIECETDDSKPFNLANAAGNIGYSRDSNQILKYEVEETIPPLYRVVVFSSAPPGGGSGGSISKMIKKIKSWFGEQLPEPETIYLSEYVEQKNQSEGVFTFPNGEKVMFHQKIEDIESFIQKSEKEEECEDLEAEIITIGKSQQTMTG